jgi:membrane-bound lytic murein transglycosylase B
VRLCVCVSAWAQKAQQRITCHIARHSHPFILQRRAEDEQASRQVGRTASRRGRQTSRHASRPAGKQASKYKRSAWTQRAPRRFTCNIARHSRHPFILASRAEDEQAGRQGKQERETQADQAGRQAGRPQASINGVLGRESTAAHHMLPNKRAACVGVGCCAFVCV